MPCTTQKSGVVVAIDGSEESNAAVRWATQEAAMRRDSLTIVSVVNREYLYIRDPETQDRVHQWQRQHAEDVLRRAQAAVEDSDVGFTANQFRYLPTCPRTAEFW